MTAAGRAFDVAGVAAVYLIHGTFAGNDGLGLYTEIERVAPSFAQSLRRATKRMFNAILGETGNYTPSFARRMEQALSAGGEQVIPVRLFNWSSMNHHIGRADAAVRFIDELAAIAEQTASSQRRVLLWAHSHGGNALAILTNLLGADDLTRQEFFDAARVFYQGDHAQHSGFAAWQRVEQLLGDPSHPVRKLHLDIVTFGTPIRYGWDSAGYGKLIHIINHRPCSKVAEYVAPYPPNFRRLLLGTEGDFVQQVGIAGTNLPPLPIAWRTFLANRRLGRMFQRDLASQWLRTRLKRGARVPDEGATLLVDYADPDRSPHRHLFGHAPYTRSRWLALHCELVAEHFYSTC
jgi:hypothetical protein